VSRTSASAGALSRSYDACARLTREHARSFYAASRLLTRRQKSAAFALYAFCRVADDTIDTAAGASREALQEGLEWLRRRLDRVYADEVAEEGPDLALADTVHRYGIRQEAFQELLRGLEWDVDPVAFQTTAELLQYCHLVAGVVGELMLPVLGASGPEAIARADDLGIAMQLTNILRDVGEDLDHGRIYLPAQELAEFGLSHDTVRRRVADDRWRSFMTWQIQRARGYYARADLGVPLIGTWNGRWTTRAMRLMYGDILRVLERTGCNPFRGRARTTGSRKLVLLAAAAWPWRASLSLPASSNAAVPS
jgi:phytoene synthase